MTAARAGGKDPCPRFGGLSCDRLSPRQHDRRIRRHFIEVAQEALRLERFVRTEVLRPAEGDRLVPERRDDAERPARAPERDAVADAVGPANEIRVPERS